MTNLPDLHTLYRFGLACVLALLAACGPGTGGTGTGTGLSGGSGGQIPISPNSDTPAVFERVCQAACDPVVLDLAAENVTLATGCRTFIGVAGWVGESPLEMHGTWQTVTSGGTTSVPAILRGELSFPDSGPQLASVELRDAANQLLFGPLELQRNDAATAPPVTPCP
jgi:hypothetical protein